MVINQELTKRIKKYFDSRVGPRDKIFNELLARFNNVPLNILQVGAIEIIDPSFRYGSGWSDFFFADYIQKNGGHLTIVDIDAQHLSNSEHALANFNIDYILILDDAINHINDQYNFIYLDGSNHPEETRDQFNKINLEKTAVLIDDIDRKGTLLPNLPFEHFSVANEMYFIDRRKL